MVRGSETQSTFQNTLFGSQEQTENLALEKAEVSSYIRETLGRERRLFAHVSDEKRAAQLENKGNKIKAGDNAKIAEQAAQAQELYDRLSTKSGDLNDILDKAASRLGKGEKSDVVKREAYSDARKALSDALKHGEDSSASGVQEDPGRAGSAGKPREPGRGSAERGSGDTRS